MSDSAKGNGRHLSRIGDGAWIAGVSPDEPVRSVAMRSLEACFAVVQHYLPLAAEQPEVDAEYVHRLRVATRRSGAAIKLFDDTLPHRDAGLIKTDLKQIRRAAGDARDYDMFISRFGIDHGSPGAQCFSEKLRARRCQAQKPIIAVHHDLGRHDCFEQAVARLLDHLRRPPDKTVRQDTPLLGQWSRSSLQPIVTKFFKSEPDDWTDLRALHRLRIRGHTLRYAMELLGAAFPHEFRSELYPIVGRVQKLLGEINDHATTLARFGDWFDEARDAAHRDYLVVLLADEHLNLAKSRETFVSWWKPRRNDIRTWFADMIASRVVSHDAANDAFASLDILLADDSVVHQKLAIGLAQRHDHRVTVAANGKQAVELFGSRDFDLVLMDIDMPEMDGLEATRIIRRGETRSGKRVPIIAVTSETQEGIRERCLAAGMDGFLRKPLCAEPFWEMLDSVRSGMSGSRSACAIGDDGESRSSD